MPPDDFIDMVSRAASRSGRQARARMVASRNRADDERARRHIRREGNALCIEKFDAEAFLVA